MCFGSRKPTRGRSSLVPGSTSPMIDECLRVRQSKDFFLKPSSLQPGTATPPASQAFLHHRASSRPQTADWCVLHDSSKLKTSQRRSLSGQWLVEADHCRSKYSAARGWRNSDEEHSSVDTFAVTCRRTPGPGRAGEITLVKGSRRRRGQRALNDHGRVPAGRI